MKEINSLIGTFYVEVFNEREEDDRLKFFDSDKRYLGYLEICSFGECDDAKIKEKIDTLIEEYEDTEDVSGVLAELTEVDIISTDIAIIAEALKTTCEEAIDNDFVNRIGEFYVLLKE